MLFSTLIWVLGILILIPFIIIGTSRLRETSSKGKALNPSSYDYSKLVKVINDYRSKGMSPDSAYDMLARMNFDNNNAQKIIYEVYYKKK
jgi:hypothetical protein